MAKKIGWKMVGVRNATHARLAAYKDNVHAAYVAGRLDLPDDQAEHLSFDYLINRLLDEAADKRKRSRAKKRAALQAEAPVAEPRLVVITSRRESA